MAFLAEFKEQTIGRVADKLAAFASGNRSADKTLASFFRRFGSLYGVRQFRHRTFCKYKQKIEKANQGALLAAKIANGRTLFVPVGDQSAIIYYDPTSIEPKTTRFLVKTLKPGDTFIDVGANYGYYSLIAASLVRPGGSVFSFEPNPIVLKVFEQSIRENKLEAIIRTFPVGIFSSDGEHDFYISCVNNSGLSSLTPFSGHLQSGALSETNKLTIRTRSLDGFCQEHGITRVDCIKIDVETAELDVLAGMSQLLAQHPPRHIICEASLTSEFASRLGKFGYRMRMLEALEGDWGNVLFELP